MGWTPEQIVGRMGLEEVEHRTSVESIYRYVYSPEGRGAGLPRQLAQRKATRGRRRRNGRPSRTACPCLSAPQRRICMPSSGTGKETSCISADSATSS